MRVLTFYIFSLVIFLNIQEARALSFDSIFQDIKQAFAGKKSQEPKIDKNKEVLNKALKAYESNNFIRAKELFSAYVMLEPKDPISYYVLGGLEYEKAKSYIGRDNKLAKRLLSKSAVLVEKGIMRSTPGELQAHLKYNHANIKLRQAQLETNPYLRLEKFYESQRLFLDAMKNLDEEKRFDALKSLDILTELINVTKKKTPTLKKYSGNIKFNLNRHRTQCNNFLQGQNNYHLERLYKNLNDENKKSTVNLVSALDFDCRYGMDINSFDSENIFKDGIEEIKALINLMSQKDPIEKNDLIQLRKKLKEELEKLKYNASNLSDLNHNPMYAWAFLNLLKLDANRLELMGTRALQIGQNNRAKYYFEEALNAKKNIYQLLDYKLSNATPKGHRGEELIEEYPKLYNITLNATKYKVKGNNLSLDKMQNGLLEYLDPKKKDNNISRVLSQGIEIQNPFSENGKNDTFIEYDNSLLANKYSELFLADALITTEEIENSANVICQKISKSKVEIKKDQSDKNESLDYLDSYSFGNENLELGKSDSVWDSNNFIAKNNLNNNQKRERIDYSKKIDDVIKKIMNNNLGEYQDYIEDGLSKIVSKSKKISERQKARLLKKLSNLNNPQQILPFLFNELKLDKDEVLKDQNTPIVVKAFLVNKKYNQIQTDDYAKLVLNNILTINNSDVSKTVSDLILSPFKDYDRLKGKTLVSELRSLFTNLSNGQNINNTLNEKKKKELLALFKKKQLESELPEFRSTTTKLNSEISASYGDSKGTIGVYSSTKPIFFKSMTYQGLGRFNRLENIEGSPKELASKKIRNFDDPVYIVQTLAQDGNLLVPDTGIVLNVQLSSGEDITSQMIYNPSNNTYSVPQKYSGQTIISESYLNARADNEDLSIATKVNKDFYCKDSYDLDIKKYPDLFSFIDQLKREVNNIGKLNEDEKKLYIALEVEKWVEKNFEYSTSLETANGYKQFISQNKNNPNQGSLDHFLKSGKGDCDVFNALYITIMCKHFGIPARPISGFQSEGGIISFGDGHGKSEIWLEDRGGWISVDATGSSSSSRSKFDFNSLATNNEYAKRYMCIKTKLKEEISKSGKLVILLQSSKVNSEIMSSCGYYEYTLTDTEIFAYMNNDLQQATGEIGLEKDDLYNFYVDMYNEFGEKQDFLFPRGEYLYETFFMVKQNDLKPDQKYFDLMKSANTSFENKEISLKDFLRILNYRKDIDVDFSSEFYENVIKSDDDEVIQLKRIKDDFSKQIDEATSEEEKTILNKRYFQVGMKIARLFDKCYQCEINHEDDLDKKDLEKSIERLKEYNRSAFLVVERAKDIKIENIGNRQILDIISHLDSEELTIQNSSYMETDSKYAKELNDQIQQKEKLLNDNFYTFTRSIIDNDILTPHEKVVAIEKYFEKIMKPYISYNSGRRLLLSEEVKNNDQILAALKLVESNLLDSVLESAKYFKGNLLGLALAIGQVGSNNSKKKILKNLGSKIRSINGFSNIDDLTTRGFNNAPDFLKPVPLDSSGYDIEIEKYYIIDQISKGLSISDFDEVISFVEKTNRDDINLRMWNVTLSSQLKAMKQKNHDVLDLKDLIKFSINKSDISRDWETQILGADQFSGDNFDESDSKKIEQFNSDIKLTDIFAGRSLDNLFQESLPSSIELEDEIEDSSNNAVTLTANQPVNIGASSFGLNSGMGGGVFEQAGGIGFSNSTAKVYRSYFDEGNLFLINEKILGPVDNSFYLPNTDHKKFSLLRITTKKVFESENDQNKVTFVKSYIDPIYENVNPLFLLTELSLYDQFGKEYIQDLIIEVAKWTLEKSSDEEKNLIKTYLFEALGKLKDKDKKEELSSLINDGNGFTNNFSLTLSQLSVDRRKELVDRLLPLLRNQYASNEKSRDGEFETLRSEVSAEILYYSKATQNQLVPQERKLYLFNSLLGLRSQIERLENINEPILGKITVDRLNSIIIDLKEYAKQNELSAAEKFYLKESLDLYNQVVISINNNDDEQSSRYIKSLTDNFFEKLVKGKNTDLFAYELRTYFENIENVSTSDIEYISQRAFESLNSNEIDNSTKKELLEIFKLSLLGNSQMSNDYLNKIQSTLLDKDSEDSILSTIITYSSVGADKFLGRNQLAQFYSQEQDAKVPTTKYQNSAQNKLLSILEIDELDNLKKSDEKSEKVYDVRFGQNNFGVISRQREKYPKVINDQIVRKLNGHNSTDEISIGPRDKFILLTNAAANGEISLEVLMENLDSIESLPQRFDLKGAIISALGFSSIARYEGQPLYDSTRPFDKSKPIDTQDISIPRYEGLNSYRSLGLNARIALFKEGNVPIDEKYRKMANEILIKFGYEPIILKAKFTESFKEATERPYIPPRLDIRDFDKSFMYLKKGSNLPLNF